MACSELIIQKIKQEGPISFRDFMEMALYCPQAGYYTSDKDKIGKQGDYYTSPYVTPVFGELIARQLEEMWHLLDKKPFTVVECGVGSGILSFDILQHLKSNIELYEHLDYFIVEKSASQRKKGQTILSEKVSWFKSLGEIDKVDGCVLSNELVDNFSVHVVVMCDELMEVFVDYNDGFSEVLKPASEKLKNYLQQLKISLPKGFRTEINLQATEWIKEVADALGKGFVLTIDYGHPSADLYAAKRSSGTLLCYHKHKINDNPYINVGEQDITTHVNFSALRYWGEKYGLTCCGFTSQDHFLHGVGLVDCLRRKEAGAPHNLANPGTIWQLHHLLAGMGNKMKVLVQQKGVETNTLSGLKFSKFLV